MTRKTTFPACVLVAELLLPAAAVAHGWYEQQAAFPTPRYDHAVAFHLYRSELVLFGGTDGTSLYNDTWILTPTAATWAAGPTAPAALTPRSRHAMAFRAQGSQVILFGGIDGTGPRNDMWAYDGTGWTQMTPAVMPAARGNHAMVYDSNRGMLILFGGWDGGYFDDTWLFNGLQWLPGAGAPPGLSARDSHAMVFDAAADTAILFGGWDGATELNDTWEYDAAAATWSIGAAPPAGLTPRRGAALAMEPRTNKAVLFGGFDGASYLDETWTYDGSAWTAGAATLAPARASHRMEPLLLPTVGLLIMVGGQDAAGGLSDTWAYVENADDYLVGAGLGAPNPNRARVFATGGAATTTDIYAYGAGQYGLLVAGANVDGASVETILTGPGPGPVYGPQVRGFRTDNSPLAKINYYAYGTLKFGVNVSAQQTDLDVYDEIDTGAGPGDVFGPHVRGWNFDATGISPITKVNFFAYSTLKFGVNVEGGDLELDNYDELVTGPGPGVVFGPVVRGFNIDGGTAASIAKINFIGNSSVSQYGINVAAGDVDQDPLDGYAEIVCAPGPIPTYQSIITGWDYDGVSIIALANFPIAAFATNYGGRVGLGDVGNWPGADILVAPGRDPAATATIKSYAYLGNYPYHFSNDFDAFDPATYFFGCNVATGQFRE